MDYLVDIEAQASITITLDKERMIYKFSLPKDEYYAAIYRKYKSGPIKKFISIWIVSRQLYNWNGSTSVKCPK